jgi:hypothetical protein
MKRRIRRDENVEIKKKSGIRREEQGEISKNNKKG